MFAATRLPRLRQTVILVGLGAVVAAALALAPAAGASAHDYLVDSTPAADSVQTTPIEKVSLTFNDRVLDLRGDGSSALMQVVGPDDRHFETGCPTILDRTVTVPVALGTAGTYTVTWQIVSADGHVVSGAIAFTYHPASDASPAAGNTTRPKCGNAAGSSSTQPPPASTSGGQGGSADLAIVVWIAAGIIVLALAGVVLVLITARRRPGNDPNRPPADD